MFRSLSLPTNSHRRSTSVLLAQRSDCAARRVAVASVAVGNSGSCSLAHRRGATTEASGTEGVALPSRRSSSSSPTVGGAAFALHHGLMSGRRTTPHLRRGTSGSSSSDVLLTVSASGADPLTARRGLNNYLTHHFPETRQPKWLTEKRFGAGCQDRQREYKGRTKYEHRIHQSYWPDADREQNPALQRYHHLFDFFNRLRGREAGPWTRDPEQSGGPSDYESRLDRRSMGAYRPAWANIWYEPHRNQPLFQNPSAHQYDVIADEAADVVPNEQKAAATNATRQELRANDPRRYVTVAQNGGSATVAKQHHEEAEIANRTFAAQQPASWWARLQFLWSQHSQAVGDIAPGKSRDIREIQTFFAQFYDTVTGFDFQDTHVLIGLMEARPPEFVDMYGRFLELECNVVNENYCPRCNLPYATTHFCGEGVRFTEFRKHRGRDAPHQEWGHEWYTVIANRAEQLWYRAVEDNIFGTSRHTQLQAERLLEVYCKTRQRGRANTFLVNLQGSPEFIAGEIVITPAMQRMHQDLLDRTPHPILITPGTPSGAPGSLNRYLAPPGSSASGGSGFNGVSQSPMQLRLDLEVSKLRREQKEQGVVRVPPEGWSIDAKSVVPYAVDPRTGVVTNWRDVKKGLETSFMSTGLPPTAYTAQERREMLYLEDKIRRQDAEREKLQAALDAEVAAAAKLGKDVVVFPDQEFYKVFDASAESLKPFLDLRSGDVIMLKRPVMLDPASVDARLPGRDQAHVTLDTRDESCTLYGDLSVGTWIEVGTTTTAPAVGSERADVTDAIVVGVDCSGPPDRWTLLAVPKSGGRTGAVTGGVGSGGCFELGRDLFDVRKRFGYLRVRGRHFPVPPSVFPADAYTGSESFEGKVIGVLDGVLHCQWADGGIAIPVGRVEAITSPQWQVKKRSSGSGGAVGGSTPNAKSNSMFSEPFSWNVPFRNNWRDVRLSELKQAPWSRSDLASLTPNRFTPKTKIFGYLQHNAVDDFVTGEYRDRLLSKQVYQGSQRFQVIPDSADRSVASSKGEFMSTHGLPGVDRRELDEGWGEEAIVPDHEVAAVEQALRDISGRRPGNFVKSAEECSKLHIPESWFTPMNWGWQQRSDQEAVLHPSERSPGADPRKLPFGGVLPPFATTHGVGERLREVTSDFARGFDVGPHGHGPHSDTHHYDTVGAMSRNSAGLVGESALLRLFNQRLAQEGYSRDLHGFAMTSHGLGCDPRRVLLSIYEWREHGRPPSLLLCSILDKYLGADIAAYNASVLPGVPKLELPSCGAPENMSQLEADGVVSHSAGAGGSTGGSVLADVRRETFAQAIRGISAHHSTSSAGSSSETTLLEGTTGYLMSSFVRDRMKLGGGGLNNADLVEAVKTQLCADFVTDVSQLIGRGIPADRVMNYAGGKALSTITSKAKGNLAQVTPPQLIDPNVLRRYLLANGFSAESWSNDIRPGLFGWCHRAGGEQSQITLDNFLIPVEAVLTWAGDVSNRGGSGGANSPSASDGYRDATGVSPKAANSSGSGASAEAATAIADAFGASSSTSVNKGSGGASNSKGQQATSGSEPQAAAAAAGSVVHMMQELSKTHDGLVLDLRYAARENAARKPGLEARFHFLTSVLFPTAGAIVDVLRRRQEKRRYVDYCYGTWCPSIGDAVTMVADFLVTHVATAAPGSTSIGPMMLTLAGGRLVDVEMGTSGAKQRGGAASRSVEAIFADIPFEFDCIAAEHAETLVRWRTHRLPLGDEQLVVGPSAARSIMFPERDRFMTADNLTSSITQDTLHGLDATLVALIRKHKEASPALALPNLAVVDSLRSDPVTLSYVANRVLHACLPLIMRWNALPQLYRDATAASLDVVHRSANALRVLRQRDADAQQEAEFRMNAERYWRKVLDGRGNERDEGGSNQRGGSDGGSSAGYQRKRELRTASLYGAQNLSRQGGATGGLRNQTIAALDRALERTGGGASQTGRGPAAGSNSSSSSSADRGQRRGAEGFNRGPNSATGGGSQYSGGGPRRVAGVPTGSVTGMARGGGAGRGTPAGVR